MSGTVSKPGGSEQAQGSESDKQGASSSGNRLLVDKRAGSEQHVLNADDRVVDKLAAIRIVEPSETSPKPATADGEATSGAPAQGHPPPRRSRRPHNRTKSPIKLFVGQIPRGMQESGIHKLFEPFGSIIACNVIRDRVTGVHRGCAFVTFEDSVDADAAVMHFDDKVALPGAANRMQVRPAHGELNNCLFVAMVPRHLAERDLIAVFAAFGPVQDCTLLRDDNGNSKGCGFVAMKRKEHACAAISGLNGKRKRAGAFLPLVVKFADNPGRRRGSPVHQGFGGGPGDGRWYGGRGAFRRGGPTNGGRGLHRRGSGGGRGRGRRGPTNGGRGPHRRGSGGGRGRGRGGGSPSWASGHSPGMPFCHPPMHGLPATMGMPPLFLDFPHAGFYGGFNPYLQVHDVARPTSPAFGMGLPGSPGADMMGMGGLVGRGSHAASSAGMPAMAPPMIGSHVGVSALAPGAHVPTQPFEMGGKMGGSGFGIYGAGGVPMVGQPAASLASRPAARPVASHRAEGAAGRWLLASGQPGSRAAEQLPGAKCQMPCASLARWNARW
jgi:RNA recognition motif-containing protein